MSRASAAPGGEIHSMIDDKVRGPTLPDDTPLCRRCHYALLRVTSPRCPECGHAFDPTDPDTMTCPGMLNSKRREPLLLGLFLVGFGAALLLGCLGSGWGEIGVVALGTAAILGIGVPLFISSKEKAHEPHPVELVEPPRQHHAGKEQASPVEGEACEDS